MYRRTIILLLVFMFMGFGVQGVGSSPILTPEEMWEDLEYVADLITRVHPDPFHSGTEEEFLELLLDLKDKVDTPLERGKFYFIVNQLPVFVDDGHTFIRQIQGEWSIPVRFEWVSDGIVVTEVHPGQKLNVGDQILEIGGKTPEDLLELLEPIIIAENPYALKVSAAHNLFSGFLLDYLGLV